MPVYSVLDLAFVKIQEKLQSGRLSFLLDVIYSKPKSVATLLPCPLEIEVDTFNFPINARVSNDFFNEITDKLSDSLRRNSVVSFIIISSHRSNG